MFSIAPIISALSGSRDRAMREVITKVANLHAEDKKNESVLKNNYPLYTHSISEIVVIANGETIHIPYIGKHETGVIVAIISSALSMQTND